MSAPPRTETVLELPQCDQDVGGRRVVHTKYLHLTVVHVGPRRWSVRWYTEEVHCPCERMVILTNSDRLPLCVNNHKRVPRMTTDGGLVVGGDNCKVCGVMYFAEAWRALPLDARWHGFCRLLGWIRGREQCITGGDATKDRWCSLQNAGESERRPWSHLDFTTLGPIGSEWSDQKTERPATYAASR